MSLNYSQLLTQLKTNQENLTKFTKQTRNILTFIELTIKLDAQLIEQTSTCCYCSSRNNRVRKIKEEAQRINEYFCKIYNMMKYHQRYSYFKELLQMIENLNQRYQFRLKKKMVKKMNQNSLKLFREELIGDLEGIFIKNCQEVAQQELQECTFYIDTIIDTIKSQKIVRVQQFTLIFIQKIKKIENKIKINLRNYLWMQHISEKTYPYILHSIFPYVTPTVIQLQFKSLKEREMLLPYIRQIIKMGKIQRLVNNWDMEKMIFDGSLPILITSKDQLFSQALFNNQDQSSDQVEEEEKLRTTSPRSPRPSHLRKHLFRKQSKMSYYNEIKDRLINTLNVLAEKKKKQNEKIKQFLNKQRNIHKQIKSSRLLEAQKCTEDRVCQIDKIQQKQQDNQLNKTPTLRMFEPQQTDFCVISLKHQIQKPYETIKDGDNFFSQGEFRSRFRSSKDIIESVTKVNTSRANYYSTLYPDHKLQLSYNLTQFDQLEVSHKIWKPVPSKIWTSKNHSKVQETDKLRIYQHKTLKSKFKIFFHMNSKITFLIAALADLTSWPKWHPNIDSLQVLHINSVNNAALISLKCHSGSIKFQAYLRVHLFRVQQKHFFVVKSQDNPQQKEKKGSFLNFLGFNKQTPQVRYKYLLLTLNHYGSKENNCQISIDIELNPQKQTKNNSINKQQLTFLINFSHLNNFWLLQSTNSSTYQFQPLNTESSLNTNYAIHRSFFQPKLYKSDDI